MVLAIIAYLGYEIISIGNGWNLPACEPEFVIPVGDREEFLKGFMEGKYREFYVVLGLPNIGKTTTVCKAAKKRPAIYINCYGCVSLGQLRAAIASSQSWLLRGLALFSQERSMESLTTLGSIWRWINRKKVVVIFDHLHSLDSAATRYLLSWAKENVDAKNLVILLIGSDSTVKLIGTRDSITRGNHINGIIDYLKTNKGMKAEAREEDLQQMLKEFVYWFGPCPDKVRRAAVTELKTGNLLQRMPQQAERNAHGMHRATQCLIKEEEVDFWYALVSNGRVKINALKYFGIDTKSGQEDPCLQVHDGSVDFRDGLCRDYHILASVENIDQELMMIDKELMMIDTASLESKKKDLVSKKKVLEKCRSDHRLETYAPTYKQ